MVSEASGAWGAEESGETSWSDGGALVGALGVEGVDGAVVEVEGHGLALGLGVPVGVPLGVPGAVVDVETHGTGEVGDVGVLGVDGEVGAEGVGVVTVTDGEGCAGGWVGLSWWPVSPWWRAIHSSWSGS